MDDIVGQLLTQKYPFRFIDCIVDFEKGKNIVCKKNVTINEYFFNGHFPGNPVLPGVIISEALAQAAILLYKKSGMDEKNDKEYLLKKIQMEYLSKVLPGDSLYIHVEAEKMFSIGGIVNVKAKVNEKIVAKGKIIFGAVDKGGEANE